MPYADGDLCHQQDRAPQAPHGHVCKGGCGGRLHGNCGSIFEDDDKHRICSKCVAKAGKRKATPAEGAGAGSSKRPKKTKGRRKKGSGSRARPDNNTKLEILKLMDAKVSYSQIADRFECSLRFLATVRSERKAIEAAAAAGDGSQGFPIRHEEISELLAELNIEPGKPVGEETANVIQGWATIEDNDEVVEALRQDAVDELTALLGDIWGARARSISVRAASTQQQRTASCGTAPSDLRGRRRQQQWQDRRPFSTSGRAIAPAPSPEVAGKEMDQLAGGRDIDENDGGTSDVDSTVAPFPPTPPAAAGLRPETAPASTPLDLECKAYYMARNIAIKTVCTRLYAGFPRSFEKQCVVIGPLDPDCFEGGYPSPRNPPDKLNDVLRDLTRLKKMTKKMKKVDAAAAAAVGAVGGGGLRASGRKRDRSHQEGEEEEESRPRPFVPPPRPFAMDSPAYQARAWDMWEPGGGGSSAGLRGGFSGVVGSRVGGKKKAGNSYVVLFDYGSVIFIHFTKQQQEAHLKRQREFLYEDDRITPDDVKTDTHRIVLWSTLPEPARLEPDSTTLRELDLNHITIIGTVLGQTVALDHYGDLVDSMMSKFVAINSGVEKTGKFTAAQKKELFQLVARNNTVRTDVISKLGILERQEAAWKDPDYNYVWEGLREEFEMDSRLRKIESKLSMLQQNTNFFIEMLHNQKSTMLEWTIIVLIAAEIVVGVCDLLNLKPFP
eukprot:g10381.t1